MESQGRESQKFNFTVAVEKSHYKKIANANNGNNINLGNLIWFFKNMEYVLQQEVLAIAMAKGIATTLFKGSDFSHIIIKQVREDETMCLMTMVKRVLCCCPYHDEAPSSPHP